MTERGHEVTVFTTHSLKKIKTVKSTYKIFYFPTFLSVLQANLSISLYAALLRMISKDNFDVVHLHMQFHFADVLTCIAAKIKGVPLVVSYHNDPVQPTLFSRLLGTIYNFSFGQLPLILCERIIGSTSDYVDSSANLRRFRNKISIIPYGINTNFFSPTSGGGLSNDIKILFVGRLDPSSYERKGVKYLLEAISYLTSNNPRIRLIIAGPLINISKELEHDAQMFGVREKIELKGEVQDSELRTLYNESYFLVLPSIHRGEAFGIPLIEAMSCGKPVIASQLHGICSIISECGILVPPKDARSLSKAIKKIIDDVELYNKMKYKCREMVVKKYDYKTNYRLIEDLYRKYKLNANII